jgi:hypothetical protein
MAEHPEILMNFPITIENHIMLLEEGGFSAVTASDIVRYMLMCFLILIGIQCDILVIASLQVKINALNEECHLWGVMPCDSCNN